MLGSFVELANPLPVACSQAHQAPAFDGYRCSVGGRVMPTDDSSKRVFVGYSAL